MHHTCMGNSMRHFGYLNGVQLFHVVFPLGKRHHSLMVLHPRLDFAIVSRSYQILRRYATSNHDIVYPGGSHQWVAKAERMTRPDEINIHSLLGNCNISSIIGCAKASESPSEHSVVVILTQKALLRSVPGAE